MNHTSECLSVPTVKDLLEDTRMLACLDSKPPASDHLNIAIKVLTKFDLRLKVEAAHSILQIPETQLGAYYKASIQAQAIEQASRIAILSAQLKNWRDELSEQPSHIPAGSAARRPHFKTAMGKTCLWLKNFVTSKMTPKTIHGRGQTWKILEKVGE